MLYGLFQALRSALGVFPTFRWVWMLLPGNQTKYSMFLRDMKRANVFLETKGEVKLDHLQRL